jgi:hypothetical protein
MHTDWRNFAVIFAVGIVLISIAAAVPLYPQSVISNLENNIKSGILSQSDVWAQQGSLTWWRLAQSQTYLPLSGIVNFAGWLTVGLSILYAVFALIFSWRQSKTLKTAPMMSAKEAPNNNQPNIPIELTEVKLPPEPDIPKAVIAFTRLDETPESKPIKEPSQPRLSKPSALWYLVPLFFGLIGGILGYVGTKSEDPDLAGNLLIFGILWTLIGGAIVWFALGALF